MIAALVPAAGRSLRMERPKLTLPLGETTVIAHVVTALRQGGAESVLVIVPPPEARGAEALAVEAQRAGATVVVAATRPADMRGSVELGLDHLSGARAPTTVLIAPGDCVGASTALVAAIVERSRVEPRSIIVPTFQGRRGHPIALPWHLAEQIRQLPPGIGINALLALHASEVREVAVQESGAVADLNTPEDYRRWAGESSI
jgi:molybdenum cofactor cytidylyltransferase